MFKREKREKLPIFFFFFVFVVVSYSRLIYKFISFLILCLGSLSYFTPFT
eukprot:m.251194 g.251194  ORF g.251194 m.251194 type:complete len:50 (+) comp131235_c0_seq1:127-276(+)